MLVKRAWKRCPFPFGCFALRTISLLLFPSFRSFVRSSYDLSTLSCDSRHPRKRDTASRCDDAHERSRRGIDIAPHRAGPPGACWQESLEAAYIIHTISGRVRWLEPELYVALTRSTPDWEVPPAGFRGGARYIPDSLASSAMEREKIRRSWSRDVTESYSQIDCYRCDKTIQFYPPFIDCF